MPKKFNNTGACIPARHYIFDTSTKVNKVMQMIEEGLYFTLNRPRQYGKTTILSHIYHLLLENNKYLAIKISFEGIGDSIFEKEEIFAPNFADLLSYKLERKEPEFSHLMYTIENITGLKTLPRAVTKRVGKQDREPVLLIDEVDKSSNNQLFVSLLGMLRDKYLSAMEGDDHTFHPVVLAGVHDVKTLKIKLRSETSGKLNSLWNIAADFTVDMTFNPREIATMLIDYSRNKDIEMDISTISERIYSYTSGYPYLVSKICEIIDEVLIPENKIDKWNLEAVEASFHFLTQGNYTTTLFDDLFKNLENNHDLYNFIFDISIYGMLKDFKVSNPIVNLAIVGIIKENNGYCQIHNRIFEQHIYDHFLSKVETSGGFLTIDTKSDYINSSGLQLKNILISFQKFMKENYSSKDEKFLEREGRLLFPAFLKPIINGQGHDFKEPAVGNERRIDIVVVYQNRRYVIELKRWYGEEYHQQGLQQLSDYLDNYSLKKGFLLIYDLRENKEYRQETIQFRDKEIFAVWV